MNKLEQDGLLGKLIKTLTVLGVERPDLSNRSIRDKVTLLSDCLCEEALKRWSYQSNGSTGDSTFGATPIGSGLKLTS